MIDGCYAWQAGGCEWTIQYLWGSSSWLEHAAFTLLAIIAANALFIVCNRYYRYSVAGAQSRAFDRHAAPALREGRFDEVIAIALRHSRSPVASLVAAGLRAFGSLPLKCTDREAIDAVEGLFRRVGRILAADLELGLGTLRTIASAAPFVGLGGTCAGILNAFRGVGMEKSAALAMIASYIAQSLLMTAIGLAVGVLAVWLHNYLWRRAEVLKSEMLKAEADTLQALKTHPQWRWEGELTAGKMHWGLFTDGVLSWEVPYDRHRALLLGTGLCGLYVVLILSLHAC